MTSVRLPTSDEVRMLYRQGEDGVMRAEIGFARVFVVRLLLLAVAGILLSFWWLPPGIPTWATSDQGFYNQTIPTRTPTPASRLYLPTVFKFQVVTAVSSLPASVSRSTSKLLYDRETSEVEPVGGTSLYQSPHERFGFCVAQASIGDYTVEQLHAGWYVDFRNRLAPPRPAGMEYAQMVRVKAGAYNPATITTTLGPIVDANPGSLWLIGNEPDRRGGQDDRTPAEYAVIYHDVHAFLKGRDPTCRVAIGGVVQPTPLRLKYLDMILDAYRSRYGEMMPVDVWNVHGFILREDWTWGAGIPPGLGAYQELGMLYEVQDNDNIEIFQRQIRAFRQWMADHGERGKPLIVSEYGVLMPPIYGFDGERVREFMVATFDFFQTATDGQIGYPADGDRLVQRWAWYSLNDYVYDPQAGRGFNGNLFDPDTREITPLGLAYGAYTAPDLTVPEIAFDPPHPVSHGRPVTVTITAAVANRGLSPATNVVVRFRDDHPVNDGGQFSSDQTVGVMVSGALQSVGATWVVASSGMYTVVVEVDPDNAIPEANEANNTAYKALKVPRSEIFLPLASKDK